jgi:sporulation protein YlmC with PRC-barrel domain
MSAILLSVKRLANYEVYDRQGNKLGAIDDLMLHEDCAKVRYAVLAFKSSFGLSKKKLFAVPLAALNLDTENECFMLDVDRDVLAQSPEFDPNSPPAAPDHLFTQRPAAPSDLVSRSHRA